MKKTLLIIDDEPSIRLLLEHYFAREYQVIGKANGLEALEWLAASPVCAAIVVDYDMPVMDGPEFIKGLRAAARHREVGVIMLSGKDSTSSKILCLKLGADDYMVKPFNPEELGLRIHNLISKVRV